MRIQKENSIALLIDIQEKLFPSVHHGDALIENVQKLLAGLRVLQVPIIYSEQYPKGLGGTLESLRNNLVDATYVTKTSFSCCAAEDFIPTLEQYARKVVLVMGIETHICVQQTVLDLLEKEYQPVVVADCVSSRKDYNKEIALERMRQEGAVITTVESILYEMMGSAKAPEFKQILEIIK